MKARSDFISTVQLRFATWARQSYQYGGIDDAPDDRLVMARPALPTATVGALRISRVFIRAGEIKIVLPTCGERDTLFRGPGVSPRKVPPLLSHPPAFFMRTPNAVGSHQFQTYMSR